MTEAERLVSDAVSRLARGRRAPEGARAELKDHLMEAASARAGSDAITSRHVEEAIASLGGEAVVRATFFPRAPLAPMHRAAPWIIAGVVALVFAIILTDPAGAKCSVTAGPGETGACSASSNRVAAGTIELAVPPIFALLAMRYLPAWVAAAVAALFAAYVALQVGMDGEGLSLRALGLFAAAGATLAVALHHLRRSRRAA